VYYTQPNRFERERKREREREREKERERKAGEAISSPECGLESCQTL